MEDQDPIEGLTVAPDLEGGGRRLDFLVVGLPEAGLWALVFLIAAVLQIGGPVLIPFVICETCLPVLHRLSLG